MVRDLENHMVLPGYEDPKEEYDEDYERSIGRELTEQLEEIAKLQQLLWIAARWH
jgi:HEPN domain-containing protein